MVGKRALALNICSQVIATALAYLLASGLVQAQSTGSINGTVFDGSGSIVPGASLVLVNPGTGDRRENASSPEGYFTFPDLAPGRYELRTAAPGFKASVQADLILTVGQQLTVRPILEVGALTETVRVEGTPPPVTTSSSSITQVVDQDRIQQLPLNGRNALQLVALVPGVIAAGAQGQFGATQSVFSVSGGRTIDMNFLLDGAANMNPYYAIANDYPNPDSLQEFAVNTRNYSAAFGRGSSSVTAVTKSGTNQLHGSAFEFLRNTELDARPFFGLQRPDFKRNQYGGTLGGPVVQNKAFFFVSYQGTKRRGSPGERRYRTFTLREREGDFSSLSRALTDPAGGPPFPNNRIPASRIRPFANNLIELLPAPNSGTEFYAFNSRETLDQNQLAARADYSFSDEDKIWFRYFLNDVPQRDSSGGPLDADWISEMPTRFQNWSLGHTHIFSPSLISDVRISYVRSTFGLFHSKPFSLAALGLPINLANSHSAFGLTPQSVLRIPGYFNAQLGAPSREIAPTGHVSGTVSWIQGKHKLDVGFELYRNRINELQNWLTGGNIQFSGYATGNAAADLLLGWFNNFRQITALSSRLRQTLPAMFVQEDLRITRNLTLSAGLRWEPVFGYVSEDDQFLAIDPSRQSKVFPNATRGLLYPGDDGIPRSIIGNSWTNFAPRIGLSWDVQGNGKTSVRVGFGRYYIPLTRGISLDRFTTIQPFSLDVAVTAGQVDNIWARPPFNGVSPFPRPEANNREGLKTLSFVPTANENAFGLPFKTQSDNQWSLSVQRALGNLGVLEVNYVGSAASHLFTSREANWARYIPGQSTQANIQQRRLYPEIGSINSLESALSSNYNALQVSFRRQYARSFSITAGYTWSKALGVVGAQMEGSNGWRDPLNADLDYGPLNVDRRHNFVASLIWATPFAKAVSSRFWQAVLGGWHVSAITNVQSGAPFTVLSGVDNALMGIGGNTADQVGDWRLPDNRSKQEQLQRWFNPQAFVRNAAGTFGSVGINSMRGPGFWNIDTAVWRHVKIRETHGVELRGSFYNVLNHANLGNPNATQSSPSFGQINSTSGPRIVELGLRYSF